MHMKLSPVCSSVHCAVTSITDRIQRCLWRSLRASAICCTSAHLNSLAAVMLSTRNWMNEWMNEPLSTRHANKKREKKNAQLVTNAKTSWSINSIMYFYLKKMGARACELRLTKVFYRLAKEEEEEEEEEETSCTISWRSVKKPSTLVGRLNLRLRLVKRSRHAASSISSGWQWRPLTVDGLWPIAPGDDGQPKKGHL